MNGTIYRIFFMAAFSVVVGGTGWLAHQYLNVPWKALFFIGVVMLASEVASRRQKERTHPIHDIARDV